MDGFERHEPGDPITHEFDNYIARAAEEGMIFAIQSFMVQAQRSPLMRTRNDEIHMTTSVVFALLGGSNMERGVSVMCIDVDAIDSFCAALQTAKNDPVVSSDTPGVIDHQIRIQHNKPGES